MTNNKTKSRMRISVVSLIMVLVVALSLALGGCGRTYPRPSLEIDLELELEIRQTFAGHNGIHVDTVWIEFYFGTYGDVSVVMMGSNEVFAGGKVSREVVGGVKFEYSGLFSKWRKGNFYTLQQLYDGGFLTRPQLRTIRDVHQEWWESRRVEPATDE